ncbi:MAG: hypothetical protein ACE5HE_06970 [Phycisphaerae bacterium]
MLVSSAPFGSPSESSLPTVTAVVLTPRGTEHWHARINEIWKSKQFYYACSGCTAE